MKTLNSLTHVLFMTIAALIICANTLTGQQPINMSVENNLNEIDGQYWNSISESDENWLLFSRDNTGLPGNEIRSIIVDDFNNIWVGTGGRGLAKYDGKVWKVYNEENSWLPSDHIFTLSEDLSGNIWIGTGLEYGFAKFDGKNWRVYNPMNSQIPPSQIYSIAFDNENNMWIGTFGSGLIKIKGLSVLDEPEWTFYNTGNSELPDSNINVLSFDNSGILWIGTKESGLVKFDGNTFTTYDKTNSDLPANHIKTLAIDVNNHLWIRTPSDGLVKYDGSDWTIFNSTNSGLQSDKISSISTCKNNDLWIGTGDGFFRYKNDDGLIDPEKEYSSISSTFMAENGIFWGGTSGGVLFKFDGNDWTHYSPENTGLPNNSVRVVKVGTYGNIWIGLTGGLVKFDGLCWYNYQPSNSYMPGYDVRDIVLDEEGNTWVGTDNGLAMIPALSLPDQHWPIYDTGNSTLPTNSIMHLHHGNGNLWIGTYQGLTRFDGENWRTYTTNNSNLSNNDIRCIKTDIDGNIWIGTFGGGLCKIAALSLNKPDWTVFNTDNSSLPDNMIYALEPDSSGNIWIGTTYNGLVKYDGNNFHIYDTTNSGLPDNNIESLKLDNDENLWVGMRCGEVAKFDGTAWTVFNPGNSEFPVYSIDADDYNNKWLAIHNIGIAVYNENGLQGICEEPLTLSIYANITNGEAPLTVTFNSQVTGGIEPYTYAWDFGDGNTSTEAKPDHTFLTTGKHRVILTVSDDDLNTSSDTVFIDVSKKQDDLYSNWQIYKVGNTGVPFDPVESILVDNYDNLWAATLGSGLVKFDGTVWKAYQEENSWLPNDDVCTLAKDLYGNIWIGTYDHGLSKFDGKNWRVYTPSNSELPDGAVTSIAFDRNNNIWFSTNEGDLVKVEGLSVADEPVWTLYNTEDYGSYDSNYILKIAIDSTGILWMGTLQTGLLSFDGDTFTTWTIPGFSDDRISMIVTDQNNNTWIGHNEDKRLARYNGTDWEIIEPDLSGADEPYFSYDKIKSLAVDDNNDLWIGTDGGLIKYNGSEWSLLVHGRDTRFIDFTSNGDVWAGDGYTIFTITETDTIFYDPNTTGLPFDDVMAVKIDSHGNSWIGTYYGLARMDGLRWEVYQMYNSDLPDSYVRDITMDDEGNIWIGTGRGVAKIPAISHPDQPWTIYNRDNSALPGNAIRCLHYGNGNLWAGTSLGFARFDGNNWEAWTSENSTLPGYGIRSIVTDRDSNIWLGTYGSGLIKLSFEPGYNEMFWEGYNTSNSNLPDNYIPALEADSSGSIWIATNGGGLVRFDGEEFTIFDSGNSELPDNFTESLKLDDEGNIWIGMRYGNVAKFDGTNWTVFNSENSVLSGDAVYSIDVDKSGNIWIATDGGGVAVYNETGIVSMKNLSLSGKLFLDSGNTPLYESMVELYALGSTEYKEQLILSGTNTYEFTGLEYGQYTLKLIPDTLSYPETLPTWMEHCLTRANAYYVSLNKNITDRDITAIQRPVPGSGTGTVTGSLVKGSSAKSSIIMSGTIKNTGIPLEGCYVFLLDAQNGTVKAFDITSAGGKFIFNKLEDGEYVFSADYKGLHMNLSNPVLKIESNNDTLSVLAVAGVENIEIQSEVVSSSGTFLENNLKVYPVPVNTFLTISNTGHKPRNIIENIRIISPNGIVLYENGTALLKGSDIEIDFSNFVPGIYLLRIQGENKCHNIKIIKN